MTEKYRVHEFVKFNYSDIGEYVDEYHTDRPLRNDILVNLLNEQDKTINDLKFSNYSRAKIIRQLTDKINQLEKENSSMKDRIINAMIKSNQVECDCTTCVCEDYVNKELKDGDKE